MTSNPTSSFRWFCCLLLTCSVALHAKEGSNAVSTTVPGSPVGGAVSYDGRDVHALINIQPLLPATLHGTWLIQGCRRGIGTAEGTLEMNINARRRVSGWLTNTSEQKVLSVRGQVSRRGILSARAQERLLLRGVVTGITNAEIQGIILRRCTGTFKSMLPVTAPDTNQPPDTNCCVNPTNPPVLFPDAHLAAYMSRQLGKPIDQIVPGDLVSLTRLEIPYTEIRDLTGLQYATNLYLLLTQGSPITNYSAVYGLPNLTYLYLANTTNPVFVTNLTQLRFLDVRYGEFTDITPLLALTNLWSLTLLETRTPNIDRLGSLPALRQLLHTDVQIIDFAPYGALTQLQSLDLAAPASDLAPLATLTNLTSISLVQFPHTNFEAGLSSMKNLYSATITGAEMRSLNWLEATNINFLLLSDNLLTNISRLVELPNLSRLDISGNPLIDLGPLAELHRLGSLEVNRLGLSNLDFVPGLSQLYSLLADENSISDLAPLETVTQLMSLSLARNHITSLAPLAGFTNLTTLDLSGNTISDLTPLASCTNLLVLNLETNMIENLTGLSSLPSLNQLSVSQNNLHELEPLTSVSSLTYLSAAQNQITNISAIASLTNLTTIFLESNQITDISALAVLPNLHYAGLYMNPLDLSAGSTASNVIHVLESRGVSVGVDR